jgi:Fe-S-cluster containining protein
MKLRIVSEKPLTRQQIWEMKRLWQQIPHIQCKGLCQKDCFHVPIMPVEALYLIEKHDAQIEPAWHGSGEARMLMPTLGVNQPCQYLDPNGRCSIYDDRPAICREFGHKILTLDCGHGCKASKPYTDEEAMALFLRLQYVLDRKGIGAVLLAGRQGAGREIWDHMKRQVGELKLEFEEEEEQSYEAEKRS